MVHIRENIRVNFDHFCIVPFHHIPTFHFALVKNHLTKFFLKPRTASWFLQPDGCGTLRSNDDYFALIYMLSPWFNSGILQVSDQFSLNLCWISILWITCSLFSRKPTNHAGSREKSPCYQYCGVVGICYHLYSVPFQFLYDFLSKNWRSRTVLVYSSTQGPD